MSRKTKCIGTWRAAQWNAALPLYIYMYMYFLLQFSGWNDGAAAFSNSRFSVLISCIALLIDVKTAVIGANEIISISRVSEIQGLTRLEHFAEY